MQLNLIIAFQNSVCNSWAAAAGVYTFDNWSILRLTRRLITASKKAAQSDLDGEKWASGQWNDVETSSPAAWKRLHSFWPAAILLLLAFKNDEDVQQYVFSFDCTSFVCASNFGARRLNMLQFWSYLRWQNNFITNQWIQQKRYQFDSTIKLVVGIGWWGTDYQPGADSFCRFVIQKDML